MRGIWSLCLKRASNACWILAGVYGRNPASGLLHDKDTPLNRNTLAMVWMD